MLTDDQINAMGRKLAESFIDYFKSHYGPPPGDQAVALHQKIEMLEERLEQMDEKFGQKLDEYNEHITANSSTWANNALVADWIHQVEDRTKVVERRARNAEKQLDTIKEQFDQLVACEGAIRKQVETKLEKINTYADRLTQLENKVNKAIDARTHSFNAERYSTLLNKVQDTLTEHNDRIETAHVMMKKHMTWATEWLEEHEARLAGVDGRLDELESRTDEDARNIADLRKLYGGLNNYPSCDGCDKKKHAGLDAKEAWIPISDQPCKEKNNGS